MLKIHQVIITKDEEKLKPGELKINDKQILVGTGQGNLSILKLQLAGQRAMSALDFINGNKINNQVLQ